MVFPQHLCRTPLLLSAVQLSFSWTIVTLGLRAAFERQDVISQTSPVLAAPFSSVQVSPSKVQVENSRPARRSLDDQSQTQGRVGSRITQDAPLAAKQSFDDLFEQVWSTPFKTGLEVSETKTPANLANSPPPPRPPPLTTPTQSVGQPSRRMEVPPGLNVRCQFATQGAAPSRGAKVEVTSFVQRLAHSSPSSKKSPDFN